MSQNLRLIIDNTHDTATLSATSEALPIAYTQRSGRAYAWRSTSTASQVIQGTLPGTVFIDAIVLYRHNLSAAATARIELLDSDGNVIHDTGEQSLAELIPLGIFRLGIDPWGATYNDQIPVTCSPFWLTPMAIGGYRITLSDDTNPAGFLQVGRIIAGLSFSPTFNPSYGLKLEWQENVEHRRTEGGSLRSIGQGLARRLEMDLDYMAETDRAKLTAEFVKRGKGADVFVSVYPEQGGLKEIEHSFLARRDANYTHIHNYCANWQSSLPLLEV